MVVAAAWTAQGTAASAAERWGEKSSLGTPGAEESKALRQHNDNRVRVSGLGFRV